MSSVLSYFIVYHDQRSMRSTLHDWTVGFEQVVAAVGLGDAAGESRNGCSSRPSSPSSASASSWECCFQYRDHMAKEQPTNSRSKQRLGAMPVRTVNRGFIPDAANGAKTATAPPPEPAPLARTVAGVNSTSPGRSLSLDEALGRLKSMRGKYTRPAKLLDGRPMQYCLVSRRIYASSVVALCLLSLIAAGPGQVFPIVGR